jgi:DNA-binding NarL/FixJ family response regulator
MTLKPYLDSRFAKVSATIRHWFLSSDLDQSVGVVSGSRLLISLLYGSFTNKENLAFAATEGKELMAYLASNKLGFIMVTEKLADMRGDELITQVRQLYPEMASILFVEEDASLNATNQTYKSPVIVASQDMLREDQALRRAILCAIGGTTYRSPSIPTGDVSDSIYAVKLSEHERKILEFYAAGLTINEMAQKLPLSQSSVKTYSRNLLQKLGVGNRQKALLKALQLGLISKPSVKR